MPEQRRMGTRRIHAMQTCRSLKARNVATNDEHNGDGAEPAPPAPIELDEVDLVLCSSARFIGARFARLPATFFNAVWRTRIASDLNE
jgi:hypothetical protein